MRDLIYCGTDPVGPQNTQALLTGSFSAVWSPPIHRHATAEPGDRVWLLWRGAQEATPVVLGAGIVTATPDGRVEWTNRTAPGIVTAAREQGYAGPTNMAFLRLRDVMVPPGRLVVAGLGAVAIGLSAATELQSERLHAVLPLASVSTT